MTRPSLAILAPLVVLLGAFAGCERSDPAGTSTAQGHEDAAAPAPAAVTVAHHYEIDGMHCEGCVAAIESKVTALPGVSRCEVDLESRRALVETASADDDAAIRAAIEKLGYKIKPVQ